MNQPDWQKIMEKEIQKRAVELLMEREKYYEEMLLKHLKPIHKWFYKRFKIFTLKYILRRHVQLLMQHTGSFGIEIYKTQYWKYPTDWFNNSGEISVGFRRASTTNNITGYVDLNSTKTNL
jgi:hypothetical protein